MVIKFTILGGARTPHWRNTQQQASTSINKHQQASTSINKHQQASTSINKHQQSPTSINKLQHRHASASINKHQQVLQASTTNLFVRGRRVLQRDDERGGAAFFSLAFAAKRKLNIKGSDCRGGGLNVLSPKHSKEKRNINFFQFEL